MGIKVHWNLSLAEGEGGYRSAGITGMWGDGQDLLDETGCKMSGTAQAHSFAVFSSS